MADIPINAAHRRVQYTSAGSAGPYSFSFAILDEGDLAVYDASSLKTLTTHYTVSLNTNGTGSITFTGGNEPTSGNIVTIESNQAIERTADYTTGGDFTAASINSELDRITIVQQQLETIMRKAIRLDDFANRDVSSSGAGPLILTYNDTEANQASKPVVFNSSGDGLEAGTSLAFPSSLTGEALKFLRVNSGATDYEFRTAAQTLLQLIATESAGILAHTDGSGAVEARTITGTANEIDVTNGDGVSGNPVLDIADTLDMTGKTLNVAAPTTANNATTKTYVDGLLAGLAKRGTVHVASTANVTIASELENGDTLDGITLVTGDLVLLKDQSNSAENGIYVVAASGAASRDDLYDTYDEHPGALIHVEEGTTNADTLYHCTSNQGGTLGVTAITWANIVPGSGGTVTNVAAGLGMNFSAITTTGTVAAHAASTTQTGVAEIATAAEINTGTDTGRTISPDTLAGSNYGTAVATMLVFDDATDCATGDGAGDIWFRVPSILNGFDLVDVAASCQTAGTTGTMDVQIHNVTQAADMLTTKITIDSAETDSSTAATAAVIDTANDDVATGDQIRIDVDAVHTTAAKGLLVEMQFRLP